MQREWRRITSTPPYWLLLTVLPAISTLLFTTIFLHGTPNKLPIALLDQDNTSLSRSFIQMIDATPEIEIHCTVNDMLAGIQAIREGKVDAIVLIPQDFEQKIYALSPTSIEAYISGINILKNGLISKGLLTTTTTFSTGIALKTLQAKGLSQQQALAQAMSIGFNKHLLFNPYTNYDYYLSPLLMPMMLIIFAMLATIYAIGSELRYATAHEWLKTAQGSLSNALAGKLLPIYAAMCFWGVVTFFTLFYIVGVPLRGSLWLLIIGSGVVTMAYMGISLVIITLTANMRLAMSLGGGYTVMSFSFCGLTFPAMAMHQSIQYLTHLFPFTYFAEIVVDQAIRGTPVAYSINQLAWMTIFLLPPLLLIPRLKRVLTSDRYFGRE